jgi:hypothetical protein
MVTGELKIKTNRLWEMFWTGGRPYAVVFTTAIFVFVFACVGMIR